MCVVVVCVCVFFVFQSISIFLVFSLLSANFLSKRNNFNRNNR